MTQVVRVCQWPLGLALITWHGAISVTFTWWVPNGAKPGENRHSANRTKEEAYELFSRLCISMFLFFSQASHSLIEFVSFINFIYRDYELISR